MAAGSLDSAVTSVDDTQSKIEAFHSGAAAVLSGCSNCIGADIDERPPPKYFKVMREAGGW